MSPTPRRVKRPVQNPNANRNRALSIVGLIVVLSMLLALVVNDATPRQQEPQLPTSAQGAPSGEQLLATYQAEATLSALVATITAQETQDAAIAATGTVSGTVEASATPTPTPTAVATLTP